MKSLTVKDVDAALLRQIKGAAAISGKLMRDWVIDALRAALPAKKGRAA